MIAEGTEGREASQAKTPAKAVAKPMKTSAGGLDAAKRAAAARNTIKKHMGKLPVKINRSSRPYVPSGSFLLDYLIGGTLAEDGKGPICPGYPRSQVTELFGPEASGKTTAALEAIAEVQKLPNGLAMLLDFEKALDQRYARSIGVSFDDDKLLFYQPDTMEEGWDMLRVGLKAGVDLVVVDSVAAMVPKLELEKKMSDAAKIGAQASNLSRALPKLITDLHNKEVSINPLGTAIILINQARAVINSTGYGDNENTAGGKALKYYAHLRIKFSKIKAEMIKRKSKITGKEQSYPYGNVTRAKIVKSKIDGTAGHTTDIFIRYGHGIDNYYSLIEAGVSTRIVQLGGGIYTYKEHSVKAKDKFRELLIANNALYEEIKGKVMNVLRDGASPDFDEDEDDLLFNENVETVEIEDASDFSAEDEALQESAE